MKKVVTLTFDYRWLLIVVLLSIIAVMTLLWRPWEPSFDKNARTVDVIGKAIVKASPDQAVFSPYYQFNDDDTNAAIEAAKEKSTIIIAELKKLGVKENAIKTQSSGYVTGTEDDATSIGRPSNAYTLSVIVTLEDLPLAQKVQDYLTTTKPEGQITPSYSFTAATQKSLEGKARSEAIKDARKKAEEMAKNLGFGVGAVKSVTDNEFTDYLYPYGPTPMMEGKDLTVERVSGLALQPGENELSYSVKVIYYIQ